MVDTAPSSVGDLQPPLAEALRYALRGWPVLALHTITDGACSCGRGSKCGSPGKHPRTRHGVSDATTDLEVVTHWWVDWPEANVGIATGETSGLIVLDIDPRHGGDDSLDALIDEHGPLPATVEVLTGGGGRHIYFDAHGLGGVANSAGRLGGGLDVRSDRGYVVAPPSTHISGGRYDWEASSHPDDVALAPPPPWLADLVTTNRSGKGRVDPLRILAGVPEGERNNEIFRYASRLRRQGLTQEEAEIIVLEACSRAIPPLPEGEGLQILNSAFNHEPTDSGRRLDVRSFPRWAENVDGRENPGWIAEPVWPGDAYGVLAAESKAGKSWSILDLAVSTATGTPWMGTYPTQKGTVVVFVGEGGERNTVRRIRAILSGRGLTEEDLGDRLRLAFRVPNLNTRQNTQLKPVDDLDEMRQVLSEVPDVRLVVIDPLYLAAGGADGASLYSMAGPLQNAQHIVQEIGAALVIVHHFNQTGRGQSARRMSGAGPEEWGRILATAQVISSSVSDDKRCETAYLAWQFTGGEIVPHRVTIRRTITADDPLDIMSALRYEVVRSQAPTKATASTQAVLALLEKDKGWLTVAEIIAQHPGLSRKVVQTRLKELHDLEQVERKGKKNTGYSYRINRQVATHGAK